MRLHILSSVAAVLAASVSFVAAAPLPRPDANGKLAVLCSASLADMNAGCITLGGPCGNWYV